MDTARLVVAGVPLALYLFLIAAFNLSRRPRVMSGYANALLLTVALAGFVVVGPMDMLLPEAALERFRGWVWLPMLSFYGLCVTLWLLLARPRIIVYNIAIERLRPLLETLAVRLDSDARIAGDALALPQLGVQLHVEEFRPLRNVSLVATGQQQSYMGWWKLKRELATAVAEIETSPHPYGIAMLAIGMVLIAYPTMQMAENLNAVAQQFRVLFRL